MISDEGQLEILLTHLLRTYLKIPDCYRSAINEE